MDSKTALTALQDFNNTRKSASGYYTDASQSLGVDAAQQQARDTLGTIRNTQTALKAVPDSVAGRTSGSLVTEAQRARLQNIESAPLQSNLTDENQAYGDQMQGYRDLLGQAQTQAGLAYQGDSDKAAALQGTYENLSASEQAAEAKRQWEAQFAESARQFNTQQATAKAQNDAMTASLSLGNGDNQKTDPYAATDKQGATNAVLALLKTNNANTVSSTINAITKSANNGNLYDKYKLELLQQYATNSGYGTLINKAKQLATVNSPGRLDMNNGFA